MKKITILLCLLIIKFNLLGQSVKFMVVAGPNESTFVQTPVNDEDKNTAITGFHAGIFFEFGRGSLSIEPGLLFASIGGNSTFDDAHGGIAGTYKNTVQYLQLPVNVLYNIRVTGGKVFLGGGPYIGFGLSGSTSQVDDAGSYGGAKTYTTNYKFANSDNPDYGLNAVAGIRFNSGLVLSLDYGYGFKYLFYKGGFEQNDGIKNNVASLSIGYAFL